MKIGAMSIKHFSIIGVFFLICCFTQSVSADVVATGDVDPDDPATWASDTLVYIGRSGVGTLEITGGETVSDKGGYIGNDPGSTGEVIVNGFSSTWRNRNNLFVGNYGSGSLDISGGGTVWSPVADVGYEAGSMGAVRVDGIGSLFSNAVHLNVGCYGSGTLDITGGGTLENMSTYVGSYAGSTGVVTVNGLGSTWRNYDLLRIGSFGSGSVYVTSGGTVDNTYCDIGRNGDSTGAVTVDGFGSTWTNSRFLCVGRYGSGTFNITGGGLVSVGDVLTIGQNGDGDSFVNMASGGMLAIMGEAYGSLDEFLGLVGGNGEIRYWDESILDWADIAGATYGLDYTLGYIDYGDLDGYTMLTVNTIPEPCSLVLLGLGGLVLRRRRG